MSGLPCVAALPTECPEKEVTLVACSEVPACSLHPMLFLPLPQSLGRRPDRHSDVAAFQIPDHARVAPSSSDPKSKFFELIQVAWDPEPGGALLVAHAVTPRAGSHQAPIPRCALPSGPCLQLRQGTWVGLPVALPLWDSCFPESCCPSP